MVLQHCCLRVTRVGRADLHVVVLGQIESREVDGDELRQRIRDRVRELRLRRGIVGESRVRDGLAASNAEVFRLDASGGAAAVGCCLSMGDDGPRCDCKAATRWSRRVIVSRSFLFFLLSWLVKVDSRMKGKEEAPIPEYMNSTAQQHKVQAPGGVGKLRRHQRMGSVI